MKNSSLLEGWRWCILLCICSQVFAMSHTNSSVMLNYKNITSECMFKQQATVTGTVTFENLPLNGVTVSVKGKNDYTITGEDGTYSIAADKTDVLIFSFIGFKTVEISINDRNVINTGLEENATAIKEITVNAGYYKVKDKLLTGSIAKVTAKDIEKQPVSNVLAAIAGRMAGVQIIQDSGSPGGAFQIKIRGQNSLRSDGNDPLYIIDGVPYSSETIGSLVTSGSQPTLTNPLSSINPADIESIEILKDGDATAIYGSRGSNGVVLITTKRGKVGQAAFSINAATSVGTVTKTLDLMRTEQYLAMRRQAFAADGFTEIPDYAYDVNGTWDPTRYTDWQKELIGGTAEITNIQASVSGGSKNTQYLLSGTTRNETTVFPGNFKYRRGTVHFNMNHKSDDDRFRLTFSASYTAQKNFQPTTDLTRISQQLAPNAPALYDEFGNLNWEDGTYDNPLANFESQFKAKINDLNANTVLSYNLHKNLQLKSSFGFTDLRNNENVTLPSTLYNPSFGLGPESSSISTNQTLRTSWIAEPQINWNFSFGRGKVEALAGSTFQNQTTNRLNLTGFGYTSNSLIYDLASAFQKFVDYSDESVYKYQAFFARVNYNYDQRYILNITGRRDGSSRFGPGKQFSNFGAVGAAWIFSNESWLKDKKFLSFGKIRGSYGMTGNDQIGDYQFLDTYLSSGSVYQGVSGLQPIRLFNADFGWETNRKLEVALETGFLNDRLFITAAYYRNRSSNQLVGIPLPGTTGFSSLTGNLDAEVQNTGYEFTLRSENFKTKDFEWSSSFNISTNENKLLSFPGLETSTYSDRYIVGKSINIRKLYHYTGLNPTTGVYEFEDLNGDGEINTVGDRQVAADLSPKYFGGVQNQLAYKNLHLDFLFQFVKQQGFKYNPAPPGLAANQLASVDGFWQPENTDAAFQILTAGNNGPAFAGYSRYNASDAALIDASFVRLKSIALSYDLPLKLSNGIKCRIYLQGQNLLTFTSFYTDPEFKFGGYLPPLKTYTAAVQITF